METTVRRQLLNEPDNSNDGTGEIPMNVAGDDNDTTTLDPDEPETSESVMKRIVDELLIPLKRRRIHSIEDSQNDYVMSLFSGSSNFDDLQTRCGNLKST